MAKKSKLLDNAPDENIAAKKEKRKRLKKEKRQQQREALQDDKITSSSEVVGEDAPTCPALPVLQHNTSDDKQNTKSVYSVLWQQYMPVQLTLVRGADWYSERPAEKHSPKVTLDISVRKKLKELAARIYKNEIDQFEKFEDNCGGREARFRRQILTHGAAKDKAAAHILRLTEAPLHSLHHLTKLTSFIQSSKDMQIKDTSKSLEEVLTVSLLPKGMMARQFEQHDFHGLLLPLVQSSRQQAEKLLLVWYFEDQLRLQYTHLITALTEVVRTSNESTKQKGVQLMLHLLGNHPQQDTELILQTLINKLGDLDKPVAIAVVYGIRNLLIRRPALKDRVADICGALLYRANQKDNTLYNCMLLLKDLLYTKDDAVLVQKMVKLYFGFFKSCTKKGEVDCKLMSIILRGLNRALPYLTSQQGEAGSFLHEQLDTLYKMCHLVSFAISVQILQLLYQVMVVVEGPMTERYHRVLYGQLLSPDFGQSSAVAPFLNLVFKTINRITNVATMKAFAKRLLQVAQNQPAHISVAIIFILAEVCVDNPHFANVIDDVATSADVSTASRASEQPELVSVVDPITQRGDDDSEDEYFEDLDVGDDGNPVLAKGRKPGSSSDATDTKPSWLHRTNTVTSLQEQPKVTHYDPYHRNPTYCGVQHTKLWGLRNMTHHYHPSVTAFTAKLLSHTKLNYNGDPLIDFAFMKFLDRFIYKNPKKLEAPKNSGGARALGAKSQYECQRLRRVNVTTEYFQQLKEAKVPEDAVFFHRYFSTYSVQKLKTNPRKGEDEDDIGDDEFDRYLETMGGKDGAVQLQYGDDDEFDDEWDFAAKSQKQSAKDLDDSDDEDDASDDGDIDDKDDNDDDDDDDDEDEAMSGEDASGWESPDGGSEDINFNEEDVQFSDEDEDDDVGSKLQGQKRKRDDRSFDARPTGKKSRHSGAGRSLEADADEFSALLQENETRAPAISSGDMVDTGSTNVKQLNWERSNVQKMTGKTAFKKPGRTFPTKSKKKRGTRGAKRRGVHKPK